MGAVFQQLVRGSWAPLDFYSKKLSSAKTGYSTSDLELLAAFSTVKHFCFLLEGQGFTLFTVCKPLTFALFRVSLPWSARQQRHLSYLSEFTSDLNRFLMLYTPYLILVYVLPVYVLRLFLPDGSVTFTWTWLALFLVPEVSLISSPSLTGPLVGLRLFLCHQPPLRIELEP